MNLVQFASSTNYAPPKFYDDTRSECYNPVHQHNSKQLADKTRQMNGVNNMNNRPQPSLNNLKPKSFMPSNGGPTAMMNQMNNSVNKLRNLNQRFIQSNGYNNFQTGGKMNSKMNDGLMNGGASITSRLPMTNRSNASTNRSLSNGYDGSNGNTLASRLNSQTGSSSPLSTASTSYSSPVDSSPTNPFSANSFGLNNAWTNGAPTSNLNSLNGNFNHVNAFNHLNASNNLSISKSLDKSPMLNSLNTSYNFGIWSNYGNNLDVSANWSKFKDRKIKHGKFASHISNDTSEEDTCSMKSDYDYGVNAYFNPMNSLNLHENFRGLSIDKSLSKYPFYNPILQQQ